MPEHMGGERFTVEVEAMPDDVPPVVRLKLWLKAALRSHRLRCRSVIDSTPTLPPLATPTRPAGGPGGEKPAEGPPAADRPA